MRPRLLIVPWLRRPAQAALLPNWLAITLGPLIVAWRRLDDSELAHEVVHVDQWRRHGLRFIVRYLRASADAARAGGDRYSDNIFEIEAQTVAEAVRRRRVVEADEPAD